MVRLQTFKKQQNYKKIYIPEVCKFFYTVAFHLNNVSSSTKFVQRMITEDKPLLLNVCKNQRLKITEKHLFSHVCTTLGWSFYRRRG